MKTKVAAGAWLPGSRISSGPPNPQTQCKFFSLPAELRNSVYCLVLEVPPTTSGPRFTISLFNEPSDEPSMLSILQTCKLISQEAEGLFFSQNHFKMYEERDDLLHMKTFIQCSTPNRISAIRTLTVIVAHIENIHKLFRLSKNFAGLTTLKVVVIKPGKPMETTPLSVVDREVPLLKKSAMLLSMGLSKLEIRIFSFRDFDDDELKTKGLTDLSAWVVNTLAAKRQKEAA